MKPADGMCGDGVRKISVRDGAFWEHGKPFDLSAFLKTIRTRWVFQPIVVNHPTLQALNPSSLNTIRMMTCWNRRTHQAELWGDSALRIGRKGELVDNLHAGGIVVGVSASGRLKPDGIAFWDNFSAARYSHHPDSGIRFGEVEIPFYKEATEVVLAAQRLLPEIPSIGWDVVITETGPILLEGNHDWDTSLQQIANHQGMMARYHEIYDPLVTSEATM